MLTRPLGPSPKLFSANWQVAEVIFITPFITLEAQDDEFSNECTHVQIGLLWHKRYSSKSNQKEIHQIINK